MGYDISIIIVSYNVKYFLAQTIDSVNQDQGDLSIEIIVVDNYSVDGTKDFLELYYPKVKLISKTENVGFARANNEAVSHANGKHILILNPDTILEKGSLDTCYDLLNQNPEIGMIGLKMVNGQGQYLPESKRGIPNLSSAFFKFSGLHNIFPNNKIASSYYLGHLSPVQDHKVDVLTGAFMYLKKDLYHKVGGFDEDYFMYGEDIDLSYRVKELGKEIQYLSEPTLLHYKGQSTDKFSFQYLHRFYNAMAIFYKKHKSGNSFLANGIIYLSILIGAVLGGLRQLINYLLIPLVELVAFTAIGFFISKIWARYYFNDIDYYQNSPLIPSLVIGSAILIMNLWGFGRYKGAYNLKKYCKAFSLGALLTIGLYSVLNLEYRTSRSILIISIACWFLFGLLMRYMIHLLELNSRNDVKDKSDKILELVTSPEEFVSYDSDLTHRKLIVRNSNFQQDSEFILFLTKIIRLERFNRLVVNMKDFKNEELKDFIKKLPKFKDVGLKDQNNLVWTKSSI